MGQSRAFQPGEVHKRGGEAVQTRSFHTIQRRQTVVHGLQIGAAHFVLHHRHVDEQVHADAGRGRVVRCAQG